MSPTILTASGITFNLLNPDPELIEIEDIAHALSNICRFTGHTRAFYSVGEHSVSTSLCDCVPPEHRLEALLHDAAEAYIGDVSSPLKAQLREYRDIESALEQAIRLRFGLPSQQTPCVKQADLIMLATEKRDLMPDHEEIWTMLNNVAPLSRRITHPLSPIGACKYFLTRFYQLAQGGAA